MKIKTLYQMLKPEIKAKLKENAQKYEYGPREVIAELTDSLPVNA